jgi:predicted phosphohydrolase
MRLVALSDLHGMLPETLPVCDLLLLAGDLCPVEDHHVAYQAQWLDRDFRAWLQRVPARKVIGVAGNHDFIFERAPQLVPQDLPWTYLQDSGVTFEGLKIWGTPWQPWFYNWAFNGQPDELRAIWAKIPAGTDVLVVHGPPYGYGDGVPERRSGLIRHTGCPHLLARIQELRPRLVVFGHIHEGRGAWQLGPTTLANVTRVDVAYQPIHPPWTFDLEAA